MNNSTANSYPSWIDRDFNMNTFIITQKIVGIILFFFGVFGNICIILVFRRPSFNHTTTSIYLRFLAVIDSITLSIASLFLITKYMEPFVTTSEIVWEYYHCVFSESVIYMFSTISSWILVCLTADRAYFILFPMKAKKSCSKFTAKIICMIVIILYGIYYSHIFFVFKKPSVFKNPVYKWNSIFSCQFKEGIIEKFSRKIQPIIHITMCNFLPGLLILIFNCLLLKTVFQASKARKYLTNTVNNKAEAKNKQLIVHLLGISCFFLLSPIPICTMFVRYHFFHSTITEESFFKNIRYVMMYGLLSNANYAINFYIFFLCGNKFRKEFYSLFKKNIAVEQHSKETNLGKK